MPGVIYCTINKINQKKYIGSDVNNNPDYLGSGKLLNAAIKKYGRENFEKNIVEFVEISQIKEREEYWLKYFNVSESTEYYNIVDHYLGGKNSTSFKNGNIPWNAGKIGQCKSLQHMKGKKEDDIFSTEALEKRRLGRIKRSETLKRQAAAMTEEERKVFYGRNRGKKLRRN